MSYRGCVDGADHRNPGGIRTCAGAGQDEPQDETLTLHEWVDYLDTNSSELEIPPSWTADDGESETYAGILELCCSTC
jgi:hypothetical protein